MVTATYPLTLPSDAGINGQWLTTNGTNLVYWSGGNSGRLVQRVYSLYSAVATGTTLTPFDDTIPQNTEGDEYMTQAITPSATTSTLLINAIWFGSSNTQNVRNTIALFQDSTANALAASSNGVDTTSLVVGIFTMSINYKMTAGTTSATTFKIRCGPNSASTLSFNGSNGTRNYGGVACSSIVISEYAA